MYLPGLPSIKDIGTVDNFRENGGPIRGPSGLLSSPFFSAATRRSSARLRHAGRSRGLTIRVCPGAFLGAGPVADNSPLGEWSG